MAVERTYRLFETKIKRSVQLAENLFLISFNRPFEFIAGQVIALGVDRQTIRYYSIAGGEQDADVEILYDIRPEGVLTPKLAVLKEGDAIFYSLPFGSFTDTPGKALWIASGTGIAPFASMFRSGLAEGKILIHGATTLDKLIFFEQFRNQSGAEYFPCTSRQQHPLSFAGRVTNFLEHWEELDTSIPVFICGSAEMVVDTRDLLISKGVPFSSIKSEIYF